MKNSILKCLFIFAIASISMHTYAQADFGLLKRELRNFTSSDTTIVFGRVCAFCNGSSLNKYYFSTRDKSKMIVVSEEREKAKKLIDSTFRCVECPTIIDYAVANYSAISNQFDSTDYFLSYVKISGSKKTFTVLPAQGECYFLGIYSKSKFTYTFFRSRQNINHLFNAGNYFWTYFSLLKNQWPEIDQ